jgi:hypothetical protein
MLITQHAKLAMRNLASRESDRDFEKVKIEFATKLKIIPKMYPQALDR